MTTKPTIRAITDFLERFAPLSLAEDWDNVGLLVGDRSRQTRRVMTCLTVTGSTVAEAIERKAELIVSHHPMMFRPVNRLTTETAEGRLLLRLIEAGIAVYSSHTAFDSAAGGINQRLAQGLGLSEIRPLVSEPERPLGAGRHGCLAAATRLGPFAKQVAEFLGIDGLHLVGPADQNVSQVAIACGAAGEFLTPARLADCDTLVLGETNFHTALAAEADGIGLILTGHYASERFAIEALAGELSREFPDLEIWASKQERDPLRWI